jgi:hypothetical protein
LKPTMPDVAHFKPYHFLQKKIVYLNILKHKNEIISFL